GRRRPPDDRRPRRRGRRYALRARHARPGRRRAAVVLEDAARGRTAAGRADVMDRTTKPFYFDAFDPVVVDLQQLSVPDLQIQKIDVSAQSKAKGSISVKGGYAKKSDIELVVKDLALTPFNPYVTGASPYSISRGSLFVTTKAKIDGQKYDTTTYLTLSDFDLASRGGQQLVLEQLGIPLTVAIALLRDWKGNIDITVPVKV